MNTAGMASMIIYFEVNFYCLEDEENKPSIRDLDFYSLLELKGLEIVNGIDLASKNESIKNSDT